MEFSQVLEAYDAVQTYLKSEGLEPAGAPREVYFVDVNAVGPDDPFADIACRGCRATAGDDLGSRPGPQPRLPWRAIRSPGMAEWPSRGAGRGPKPGLAAWR